MTNFPGRDFMTLLLCLNHKFDPESKNITYDIIPELSHSFPSKTFPEYRHHFLPDLKDGSIEGEPLLTSLSEVFKYL